MSVQGPFPIECGTVFPFGVGVVGAVAPQFEYNANAKPGAPKVQERDKDSGLPVWTVDVMDFDPDARERAFKVKVSAQVQPVPPALVEGTPVRPVYLDGLLVMPYLKDVGTDKEGHPRKKIAYSLRASGLSAPRRHAENKA